MENNGLSDALFLIKGEIEVSPEPAAALSLPDGFIEAAYLRAFPDVGRAIAAGERKSPLDHHYECGQD